MRFIIREIFYFLAALASLYGLFYMLYRDGLGCATWTIPPVFLVAYTAYHVCRALIKRKNKEIKRMAARYEDLEGAFLGDKRRSSGYDPDDHNF